MIFEVLLLGFFEGLLFHGFVCGNALGQVIDAYYAFCAPEFHELYLFHFAGLKADGVAGGHVEAHPKSGGTVKGHLAVHFKKMAMGADLYGAVTGIHHFNRNGAAALVGDNIPWLDKVFSGNHVKGF